MNLRSTNFEIPTMDRYWAEQIVAFMILQKYLKEDFHFTAYNTISYIRKGPNIPKKEDDILFHGARVLKLPEKGIVWDSVTTYSETVTERNETPKSKTQPEKRRQNSTGRKKSVKKTKITSSGTANRASSSKGTPSKTSCISPKKLNLNFKSPKAAGASNKTQEDSVVMDASKRLSLLQRENIIKSNKTEASHAHTMDDVIFIPEEDNVIEIFD